MSKKSKSVVSVLVCVAVSVFIGWIIYLANTGGSSVFFDLVRMLPAGDKLGHFLLFGTLTWLFCRVSDCKGWTLKWVLNRRLNWSKKRLQKVTLPYASVMISVFVLLEEISQNFVPSRTFDGYDLLFDGLGIVAFTVLALRSQNAASSK